MEALERIADHCPVLLIELSHQKVSTLFVKPLSQYLPWPQVTAPSPEGSGLSYWTFFALTILPLYRTARIPT